MRPGWYPDPFSAGMIRWWDGTAWTSFAQSALPELDPRADLAREHRSARRASLGLIAMAAITIVGYLMTAVFGGHEIRQVVHDFRDNLRAAGQGRPTTHTFATVSGPQLVLEGFEVVGLGAEILFMVWLHRAATVARRVGLPARRATVWAWLGFILPVVNFWFPYQVAADALPREDAGRRVVAWWWTWWLCQGFLALPILVVSYFARPVAVAVAFGASAVPVAAAAKGRQMIAATLASHRRMLGLGPSQ